MSNELSKLWRPQDNEGTRLYSGIPNCLLREIINGTYKPTEAQVLLFIARMSYGIMRREQTNYLGLGDIEAETGIKITHLSKIIKELIRKGILLRGKETARMYKYAINLYYYGLTMKYYRIRSNAKEIEDNDEVFGQLSYQFGKSIDGKKSIIVYNSKGYDKQEKGYIKKDINTDIKKDNVNSGLKIAEVHGNSSYATKLEKLFFEGFKKKFNSNPTAETILQHLDLMREGLPNKNFGYFQFKYAEMYVNDEKNQTKQQHYTDLFDKALKVASTLEFNNAPDKSIVKVDDVLRKRGLI